MNILHVTPHLGGGVGKAHAAISAALPKEIDQTFLLLEEPRDRRFSDMIAARGGQIVVAGGLDGVAKLAGAADIVQFEFWNHPRLFECLARVAFPAMRSVFWSHISGLFRPVIQPGLIDAAGRFVFTTEASQSIPWIATLPDATKRKTAVINSGFGFAGSRRRAPTNGLTAAIAYLGTVDFIKVHPGFFDVIDRLDGDIRALVWGNVEPEGAVVARARAMRYPERINFGGQTAEPDAALSGAEIVFYPLQPDHYGTAENALIEAMSLGLVPVVLDNPAEMTIIRHGETGFVARSIDECAVLLQELLSSPDLREQLSSNAMRYVAETRTPTRSAQDFVALWQGLLGESKRLCNFRDIVGENPSDWFLATQRLPGESWKGLARGKSDAPSKGVLAHFEDTFPGDASLSRLVGL